MARMCRCIYGGFDVEVDFGSRGLIIYRRHFDAHVLLHAHDWKDFVLDSRKGKI